MNSPPPITKLTQRPRSLGASLALARLGQAVKQGFASHCNLRIVRTNSCYACSQPRRLRWLRRDDRRLDVLCSVDSPVLPGVRELPRTPGPCSRAPEDLARMLDQSIGLLSAATSPLGPLCHGFISRTGARDSWAGSCGVLLHRRSRRRATVRQGRSAPACESTVRGRQVVARMLQTLTSDVTMVTLHVRCSLGKWR